jgi:hypothetical protein
MTESNTFDSQRKELRMLLEQHRKVCVNCNNTYYCDNAIDIINQYMADQEQQGN